MSAAVADFSVDERVVVRRFLEHREGESVTLADPGRGVFVSIPAEGLEIVQALRAGQTVGDAARGFERAHGEMPDMDDFLGALSAHGFIGRWGDPDEPLAAGASEMEVPGPGRVGLGRRVFGVPARVGFAAVVAVGVGLVASDPGVVPGPGVLVFHRHIAVMVAVLLALNLVALVVHETAHVLAAWACGVPARVRASHRLWFLVAETDMTGVWLAPKRSRYLAFLAGMIIDAVSVSVVIALVWATRRGWIDTSAAVAQLGRAVLFEYLVRLLWQCCVFMRTDLYFVLATRLDAKRLLADTEDLARNWVARRRGRPARFDQSGIAPAEMRAIRGYLVVWVGGRLLALASLAFITVPVLVGYASQLTTTAAGSHVHHNTIDILTAAGIALVFQGGGLLVWVISLYRKRTHPSKPN